MRDFHDALTDAFERHERMLSTRASDEELAIEVVIDIKRKRRARASLQATGSLAGVAAVAALVVTVPALVDGEGGHQLATRPLAADAPAWCDLDSYPAVNVEAMGPARYLGREYADYETLEHYFVHPDGTVEERDPPSEGDRMSPEWTRTAMDYFGSGGGGGGPFPDPEYGPGLGYEWTTVAPDEVPEGVNPVLLAEVHTLSLGFSGTGLEPNVAGADAVVETIVRWTDGSEERVRIGWGHPGGQVKDFEGLESVSIRATLPSGETYEITSYYDATMTYEAACFDSSSLEASPSAEPTPSAEEWVYNYGPYLLGPESSLFACNAPLPEGLDAQPLALEYRQGSFYDINESGVEFDFGDNGFAITVQEGTFDNVVVPPPYYPGWGGGWSDETGINVGVVTFAAFVWVDEEDRIIARQVDADPELDTSRVEGREESTSSIGGSNGTTMWYVGDLSGEALPCDGVDAALLDSAQLVMIHGYGASADAMDWAIYRP